MRMIPVTTRHFCVSEVIEGCAHAHASAWLTFTRDADTVTVHPANSTHLDRSAIIIQCLSAEASQTIGALAERQQTFRDARLRPSFLRIWRELHDRDHATGIAIDGAIFLLVAELFRMTATARPSPKPALASQLEAFLDASPDGQIIAQLAARNRMSTRTYVRRFRLETGFSVTQYVSQLRAERAKTLLRTTSLSMLEIALNLGYCDRSHFARAFSRAVGMTPSQYRASIV